MTVMEDDENKPSVEREGNVSTKMAYLDAKPSGPQSSLS